MANRNALVGMFVVVGLTLFAIGLFLVGNRHGAFARHVAFYSEFADLNGLTTGSKVKVAGMDAGQIVDVRVPDSPSSRFRIKFQIDERLRGLVRKDSVVTIATEGVVGGTYLLVRSGSLLVSAAAPLATLPSQEPADMSKLLERGVVLVQDADTTVNRIGAKLDGTLDGITTTVANVDDLVVGLKRGRGPVGMLLRDEALASQIRQAVTNVQQATADVRHASGQVDAMTSDLLFRGVTKKIDETIGIAKDAASNIDDSAKQIRQTIATATGPDEKGVDAATNVSKSLSNLNTASANMAEDTEALKHNFSLRGFFHHRGYYNLDYIPPDKYRTEHVFTDARNYRAWLTAAELFERGSDGAEALSSEGRQALNAAIMEFDESITGRPIVIEGYSDDGNNVDQLFSSRHRAMLVRKYLQNHFQLEENDLGIVSLQRAPPNGLGRSHWDGICVVLLRRRQ